MLKLITQTYIVYSIFHLTHDLHIYGAENGSLFLAHSILVEFTLVQWVTAQNFANTKSGKLLNLHCNNGLLQYTYKVSKMEAIH